MELYGLVDLSAFDYDEVLHIRCLYFRMEALRKENDKQKLSGVKKDELRALEWVFELLDEIMDDEDD